MLVMERAMTRLAELVAWCDYRRAGDQSGGKIAGEGAIDVPDVREAIKHIMEGPAP
jgi:chromosome segregation protein